MPIRATASEVRQLADLSASASVDLFINHANLLVEEELNTGTLMGVLSEARLTAIENLLAAHFTVLATEKGALASTEIGDSRDRLHNIYDKGLQSTRFGQQAIMMDTTGRLRELSNTSEIAPTKKAIFRVV